MRSIALVAALSLAAAPPPGIAADPAELRDSTAAERSSVAVTVYNANLALVRETRTLDIDRPGTGRLRFMDVPSAINPRTVHLRPLSSTAGPAVLEQNYEYDLISPEKLMEKYVGREVEVVEQADDLTTRASRATLLSVQGGPVFRIGDRIVLGQPGHVTLPALPDDLVARPTLVWTLDAPRPGKHDVEVSYLTEGMTWSADYVAVVSDDDRSAGLTGWVTLENRSGAAFRDATLKLVAGDVRRVAPEPEGSYRVAMAMEAKAAAPAFQEEALFEYHMYTLDRPTTIKENQTKQLTLLQAQGVPVSKKLLLVGQPWWYRGQQGTLTRDEKIAVILEVKNASGTGLGIPLPKGVVRVYKRDRSGAEQFVGEDAIDHTPADETLRLHVGSAFDVVADRTQMDWRAVSPRESESAYQISIRNRKKDEDVVVTVREPVGGDWKLLSASHPGKKLDAGTIEFEVPVRRGQVVDLTYRVAVRW